jgi:hypothetical protein
MGKENVRTGVGHMGMGDGGGATRMGYMRWGAWG